MFYIWRCDILSGFPEVHGFPAIKKTKRSLKLSLYPTRSMVTRDGLPNLTSRRRLAHLERQNNELQDNLWQIQKDFAALNVAYAKLKLSQGKNL